MEKITEKNPEGEKSLDGSPEAGSPSAKRAPESMGVDILLAIGDAAREAAIAGENVEKLNRLFAYPAADESKDRERLTFVEVGGGSTHARIYALTRAEIEILDLALKTILYARHATSRTELARLSAQVASALPSLEGEK